MPTENRSSNTEMVSVPRQLTREMLNGVCMHPDLARSLWSALLKNAPQPAEQYQNKPVALPACNAKLGMSHDWDQGYADGWSACLDEIAKLGPLYTHADPGKVERLVSANTEFSRRHLAQLDEIQLLSAQQAETIKLITWLCNDIDSGMTSTWHAKLKNHLDGLPKA